MIIIHGDNQAVSRSHYLEIKRQKLLTGGQLIELTGQGLTSTELSNKTGSSSLLGTTNIIFITDLFSGRPSRDKNLLTDYLLSHIKDEIFLWESKDVSFQLKRFPQNIIQKYDLPKYVFQFLDHPTLTLLHQSLANSVPEQIFSLLVSHIRKLLIVSSNSGNYPAWQQAKLKAQALHYGQEKLISLYKELLQIDYKQKTSVSPFDLAFSLELWVSRL